MSNIAYVKLRSNFAKKKKNTTINIMIRDDKETQSRQLRCPYIMFLSR